MHPTCRVCSSRATLSLACHAIELRHFLHSSLTCLPSRIHSIFKSGHPFASTVQQLISSSGDNIWSAALWADHWWNLERLDKTRLRIFIPNIGTHPPACTNWAWPLLWPVSVAQKNKPLIMFSSNVQSINLLRTARPNGSGGWDNRMAAQHFPWDLLPRSSGLKNGSKK